MSYSSSELEAFYCSICGSPADDCDCVTIYLDDHPGSYCEICGGPIGECNCCSVCYEYPCICEKSGGNTGGGGATTHLFTTTYLKEITAKAVAKVFSDHNYDLITVHCNEGVRNAFNQVSNTKELNNMNANSIVKYWQDHPTQWIKISMEQAERYANFGYFVVAGWGLIPKEEVVM